MDDSLAQLVEHNTFNVGVLGSSPKRITRRELQRCDSLFFMPILPLLLSAVCKTGALSVNSLEKPKFD